MEGPEFDTLIAEVLGRRDYVATFWGAVKGEMKPVGFVGLVQPLGLPFMFLTDMTWFPWASNRHKLANALRFFNDARTEVNVQTVAELETNDIIDNPKTKGFYTYLCRYGVMRRVGQLHDFYGPGRHGAVFQTKRKLG